jgi:cytochrome c
MALTITFIVLAGPSIADTFGLGRPATVDEVAAWDIDIRPDGKGLPEGRGTAAEGEEIYAESCAICHGDFGEGIDRWPVLVGGADTLENDRPVKTIGSYWPYASTIWDYVHRAMPFGEAQSLDDNQVYAITAYLLYMNDILDDDEAVLSHETFVDIVMPNVDGFIEDGRADVDGMKGVEPCMSDCTDGAVTVTMRARFLDVTPEGDD